MLWVYQGCEYMVFPRAGNVQVRLGIAFLFKPKPFQQSRTALVGYSIGGHHAVHVELVEHIV